MIRVCYTVDSLYVGGAERYVEILATSLGAGFHTSVLAGTAPGLDAWCESLQVQEVNVVRVPMDVPFKPWRAREVTRAIRSLRPDIVHVNMPGPYDGQMGLLAPLGLAAGAKRALTTEHLPMAGRLWKRALVKNFALRSVTRVLTVSEANVEFLRDLQGVDAARIEVVYNGIADDYGAHGDRQAIRSELGIEDDTVALVFVGSISERKGVEPLLEALAAAQPRQWRLFLVGDGPDKARFKSKAAALALQDRVRFLGHAGEARVEALLAGMDVFVLPSFIEGLPYAIVEAMACGLPVVATDVFGIPEAAPHDDTALLVPPGDVRSLTDALSSMIADGNLRAKMGERGRERFRSMFTLTRHVERMRAVYSELLEPGPQE